MHEPPEKQAFCRGRRSLGSASRAVWSKGIGLLHSVTFVEHRQPGEAAHSPERPLANFDQL